MEKNRRNQKKSIRNHETKVEAKWEGEVEGWNARIWDAKTVVDHREEPAESLVIWLRKS